MGFDCAKIALVFVARCLSSKLFLCQRLQLLVAPCTPSSGAIKLFIGSHKLGGGLVFCFVRDRERERNGASWTHHCAAAAAAGAHRVVRKQSHNDDSFCLHAQILIIVFPAKLQASDCLSLSHFTLTQPCEFRGLKRRLNLAN